MITSSVNYVTGWNSFTLRAVNVLRIVVVVVVVAVLTSLKREGTMEEQVLRTMDC